MKVLDRVLPEPVISYDDYINEIPPVELIKYAMLSDTYQDAFYRCSVCKLKYEYTKLRRVGIGQYVCAFCSPKRVA